MEVFEHNLELDVRTFWHTFWRVGGHLSGNTYAGIEALESGPGRIRIDCIPWTREALLMTETELNTKLQAIVYELADALREILDWADRNGCSDAFQRNARAALAKAGL